MRLRQIKQLVQGHTVMKTQSQDLDWVWPQIPDFLLLAATFGRPKAVPTASNVPPFPA